VTTAYGHNNELISACSLASNTVEPVADTVMTGGISDTHTLYRDAAKHWLQSSKLYTHYTVPSDVVVHKK